MDLDSYLKLPESPTATHLANCIGEPLSNLSMWRHKKKPVPKNKAILIERETGGLVTRKDLCPDWDRFWPDLAGDGVSEESHQG